MATKKERIEEYTIEELEEQYKLADEKRNTLRQQIEQKKKEEKELREAQLSRERDVRKAEVDKAIANCKTLLKAYMLDYGVYSFTSSEDDEIFNSRFWNWIW